MANILYRGSAVPSAVNSAGAKNASLTNVEIDQNFYALNRDKFETAGGTISGDTTFSTNVTVTGNLVVNGTTTTINTANLQVTDANIELGKVTTPTNTTANGGGITLKGATDKTFNWYSATSAWTSSEHISLAAGKNLLIGGSTSGTITFAVPAVSGTNTITFPAITGTVVTSADTGTVTNTMLAGSIANSKLINSSVTINSQSVALGNSITLTSDNVGEGASNLYFTTARARASVSVSGSLGYNSTTGVISYTTPNTDGISEGASNLYFTTARARASVSATGSLSYNSTTGVISYTTPNTTGIAEGTNLYYTDARARASISVSGSLGYNSTTGVISYTTPSTTGIAEGSNLYFTTARARASISVSGSLGYDANTGIVSYTTPSSLPASDVYAWAKQSTKPAYSQNEISGLTSSSVVQHAGLTLNAQPSAATLNLFGTSGAAYSYIYNSLSSTAASIVFANTSIGILGSFDDSGNFVASGNVTANSDARLKTNVSTISNALDLTLKLRGVSFDKDGSRNIGLIAQEVREIIPEVVLEGMDEAKTLSVAYGNIVGVLIEAIKELNAKVENLQNQLTNK